MSGVRSVPDSLIWWHGCKPFTAPEVAATCTRRFCALLWFLLISYASLPAAHCPEHGQGQGNLINSKDHLINASTHFFPWKTGSRAQLCRQWSAESKEICADHVIIYGSYDRCKRPNQWMSSCFHFKCIIYNSAPLYMHIVLNNQWVGLMSCVHLLVMKMSSVKTVFFLHQVLRRCFSLIEWNVHRGCAPQSLWAFAFHVFVPSSNQYLRDLLNGLRQFSHQIPW